MLKAAETAINLGIDTVVITHCLFKVKVELVRVVNTKARNEEVITVKKLITEKSTIVGDDVLADLFVSTFACGTPPPRVPLRGACTNEV